MIGNPVQQTLNYYIIPFADCNHSMEGEAALLRKPEGVAFFRKAVYRIGFFLTGE